MRKIKLFLASSQELNFERDKIGLFINKLNNKLSNENAYIEIVDWHNLESGIKEDRIQNYFNKELLSCDIVLVLFYRKMGLFTYEEFQLAYKNLSTNSTPSYLYVFFKVGDIRNDEIKEDDFKILKLRDDIKKKEQMYHTFTTTEDILSQFKDQLELIVPKILSNKIIKDEFSYQISTIIDSFYRLLKQQANSKLLSYSTNSNAPQTLTELFVEPELTSKAKSYVQQSSVSSDEDIKTYCLNDLFKLNHNILLIGKKESGKTTLLNYIGLSAVGHREISHNLPIYINFNNIPKGKFVDIVKNTLLMSGYDLNTPIKDLEKLLDKGKFLILIDDLNFTEKNKIKKLKSFLSKYPKNRYVFSIEEDLRTQMDIDKKPHIGSKYETIYIQPFNRHRVRLLIEKWFQSCSIETEKILNNVLNNLLLLNVPRTPVFISMLLWIFENQENYVLNNKASLLEKFIEIIMDKYNIPESLYGKIDYRDREHYLSFIAYKMVKNNKYYFDNILSLERLTIQYFENRGLNTTISKFIQFFFERGLLIELPNRHIVFKFNCFCSFFIAKRMTENETFYKQIINNQNYLDFISEIDIMTGLQRNNRTLIDFLDKRLQELFERSEIDIDLDLFENIHINNANFSNISKKIIDQVDELNDEERDDLLDTGYNNLSQIEDNENLEEIFNQKAFKNTNAKSENLDLNNDKCVFSENEINKNDGRPSTIEDINITKLSTIDDPKILYWSNLIVFTKVIKNCELIEDLNYRKRILNKCLFYWSKLIMYLLSGVKEELKIKFDDELKEKFKDAVKSQIEDDIKKGLQDDIEKRLNKEIQEKLKEELFQKLQTINISNQEELNNIKQQLHGEYKEKLKKELKIDLKNDFNELLQDEVNIALDKEIEENHLDEIIENEEKIKDIIKTSLPLALIDIVSEEVAAEKLEVLFKDGMFRSDNKMLTTMIYVFIYYDIGYKDRFNHLDSLIKMCAKKTYMLELISVKLVISYMTIKCSKQDRIRLENMIAKIQVNLKHKKVNKTLKGMYKSNCIKGLREMYNKKRT